jgi:ATP-dependent Lon protease
MVLTRSKVNKTGSVKKITDSDDKSGLPVSESGLPDSGPSELSGTDSESEFFETDSETLSETLGSTDDDDTLYDEDDTLYFYRQPDIYRQTDMYTIPLNYNDHGSDHHGSDHASNYHGSDHHGSDDTENYHGSDHHGSDDTENYDADTELSESITLNSCDTVSLVDTKTKVISKNKDFKFKDYIEQINTGDFFVREPVEDRQAELKRKYSDEELDYFKVELKKIRQSYLDESPSVIDIIKRDIPLEHKRFLLEKIYTLANSEVLSEEYTKALQSIHQFDEKFSLDSFDYYKNLINEKLTSENNRTVAMEKLRVMETYKEKDTSEYAKYKHWLDTLLSVPFDEYKPLPVSVETSSIEDIRTFMKKTRDILDEEISFMENPKDQVINLVAQMIRKENCGINAIGLYGEAGIGKSSLIKSIAKALDRPYRMISLGGESDNSVLIGHGHTYVGSCQGRIIDVLRESSCMNPVILIDELDKISDTPKGREIIGTLIHLTDHTTNNKFNYDRYLAGIEFDLSKVLFVFTYNDPKMIDKILSDRLYKIKVDPYTFNQKLEISTKHVIPKILHQFSYTDSDIIFSENAINKIIRISSTRGGIRDIKRSFELIVSRINTILMTGDSDIIRLGYKSLTKKWSSLPVTIGEDEIDILLTKITMDDSDPPPDGMYL